MELILCPTERDTMKSNWDTLFRDRLFLSERIFLASGKKDNDKCGCIDQGLWLWKSISEFTFGHHLKPCDAFLNFRKSSIWLNGFQNLQNIFDSNECKSISDMLFLEGKDCCNTQDENLKNSFIVKKIETFLSSWECSYIPEGLSVMPWRVGAYATNHKTGGESNKWHYDLDMAENIVFFMINISGDGSNSSGGTSFLSSSDSFLLSSQSGYISTPLPYRSESLEVINWTKCNIKPEWHPALSGTVLAFMPSRVLHKGDYGKEKWRQNLHLSISIVPSECQLSSSCLSEKSNIKFTIGDLSMHDRLNIALSDSVRSSHSSPYLVMPTLR